MRRFATCALFAVIASASAETAGGVAWEKWSPDLFARAQREHKLVILDLEAVWCHWCHVMEETSYRDPAVLAKLGEHYIAVRVDQESRPDLANRYEDYGWPATIVFSASGQELAKRSGYIEPVAMASMLQAFIDDPTPGPSVGAEPVHAFPSTAALSDEQRARLLTTYRDGYDDEQGSWGIVHKYLEPESVEYSLLRATAGDADAERMARTTLTAAAALVDPAWGGIYQYSTGGRWDEPHFEKIMPMQADNLRIYSLAYATWHEPAHLAVAQAIVRYLRTFLRSHDGAFYTSQDADLKPGEHSAGYFALGDAERRKLGMPRIDQHIYSRENGWAINALAVHAASVGDDSVRADAVTAARWIVANRGLADGGFRHDASDDGALYLGDTLAMGRAMLQLYAVTGDREWLAKAAAAAEFIGRTFADPASANAGYVSAKPTGKAGELAPKPTRDENLAIARFANLLGHHTGVAAHRAVAERAFRFVAEPSIASRRPTAGVLIADAELSAAPLHLTVVGGKDDATCAALFRVAAGYPTVYKRVDWWDPREGPLANDEVQYPASQAPAAFICTGGRCSSPVKSAEALRAKIDKATK